jgi:hypothetical protein
MFEPVNIHANCRARLRESQTEVEQLRLELAWRREERERAFALLGADDYPDGDLCDWIGRLRSIVEKLPETADGVPVVPQKSTVYWRLTHNDIRAITAEGWWVHQCYSTREAAEKAKTNCEGDA